MGTKGVVGRDLHDKKRNLEIFLESTVDESKRKDLEAKIKELKEIIKESEEKNEV